MECDVNTDKEALQFFLYSLVMLWNNFHFSFRLFPLLLHSEAKELESVCEDWLNAGTHS